ncbi:hypothetical protein SA930_0249 [Staphylococcus aureus 930918-3]|uniref:Hypothetical phage protein n=1 Tax=Staphylococcus aureus (strain MRSA252) TaxID=282458 RepID=A0A7U7EV04_STAAR|nr:hypothetical protein SA930_0249 [Staphylococcus aureus 930918-3]EEW46617.1 hypothetical protein SAD30_0344 [Staphylococcus aureus D30]CAG40525.1 hypothetical phage protein [Staphylococcus aureus subsp. aureus MRSA252]CAG42699.1 hypothetical phage protein [Staphylococcus aureus subsp. aureus MSSA476]
MVIAIIIFELIILMCLAIALEVL